MRRGLRQLCISFWPLTRAQPPLDKTKNLLSQVQLNMQIHMGSPWIVLRTEAFLGIYFSHASRNEDTTMAGGTRLVKDVCH